MDLRMGLALCALLFIALLIALPVIGIRRRRAAYRMPYPRDALLSDEALNDHARELVSLCTCAHLRKPPSIDMPMNWLSSAHKTFIKSAGEQEELLPAARWIIDHMPRLNETALRIDGDLRDAAAMPAPGEGPYRGLPRSYAIAVELVAHLDARLTLPSITAFLEAYQATAPLRMEELWALPLMLRIALIHAIGLSAHEVRIAQEQRRAADMWIERLLLSEQEIAGTDLPDGFSASFIERCAARLREEAVTSNGMSWLLDRLRERDVALDPVVANEHRLQARNGLLTGNAIESLRWLDTLDWAPVFESLSPVDQLLKGDPSGVYPRMDFESRQQVREAVYGIAKSARVPESRVARQAIACAREAEEDDRRAHVGWYLCDQGVDDLWASLGGRPLGARIRRHIARRGRHYFLVSNVVLGYGLSTVCGLLAAAPWVASGMSPFWAGTISATLLSVPVQTFVLWLCSRVVARVVKPKKLLRVEVDELSVGNRAAVAVPALITGRDQADTLIRGLERHFLANRLPGLSFVLIGDFKESDREREGGDEALIDEVQRRIDALNQRHGERFFYIHRPRKLADGVWRGWERKRGALHQFNEFLLEGTGDFLKAPAHEALRDITRVITLDADTILPPGAAKMLLGAAQHPLNQPGYADGRRIGPAVIVPRLSMPISSIKTRLQALFGGERGYDSYSGAVSEMYQDISGEGIFTGKGIYDVAAFHAATAGTFPENAILSHDLIEGLHAGATLASDVQVFDAHPAGAQGWALRKHRWIRGDWQLLPWLFAWVRNASRRKQPSTLHVFDCFKIYDNLRRSLVAPTCVLCVVIGAFSGTPWLGILALLLTFFDAVAGFWGIWRADRRSDLAPMLARLAVSLALLPFEAVLSADAIVRTLWRLIARKRLLEWVTAADIERRTGYSRPMRRMIAEALAIGAILAVACLAGRTWGYIALAAAWLSQAAILKGLSQPIAAEKGVRAEDRPYLYDLALRTWRCFETMVTERELYLPPDNLQLEPQRGMARRTSPTNIGMYLISCCSAWRMGIIGRHALLQRVSDTVATLEGLPRWNGHLYNWISTIDGSALTPRYVSSVDSGNLVASLWVTAAMLREAEKGPAEEPTVREGLCAWLEWACEQAPREGDSWARDLLKGGRTAYKPLAEALRSWGGGYERVAKRAEEAAQDDADDELLAQRLKGLASHVTALADAVDFTALYDEKRRLFSIGYDDENHVRTNAYYDLLASESRLLSMVAIAQGQVPARHFLALGRPLGQGTGGPVLLSWSGTMFEYLLPMLFMREPRRTLLGESCRIAVETQRFETAPGAPWGTSESGYCSYDLQLNYQYHAFGCMPLALKGGLPKDRVIAPYASAMAMGFLPDQAVDNLRAMDALGWKGELGFYEAADATPTRTDGALWKLVKSHMSHHQGMIMMSLCNALSGWALQTAFHRHPGVAAHAILLEEAPPRVRRLPERIHSEMPTHRPMARRLARSAEISDIPETHLLAGGNTLLLCTSRGPAWMLSEGVSANRFTGDALDDRWGLHIALRDEATGDWWSACGRIRRPQALRCVFEPDRVLWSAENKGIASELTARVSPEDGSVSLHIKLTNTTAEPRELSVTSFFEASLALPEADRAHPAFMNLFIEAQSLPDQGGLLLKRRARDPQGEPVYLVHAMGLHGVLETKAFEFEASREAFFGRSGNLSELAAMTGALGRHEGAVIDPASALRRTLILPAGATGECTISLGFECGIEGLGELLKERIDERGMLRIASMAFTYAQVEMGYLPLNRTHFKAWNQAAAWAIFGGMPAGHRRAFLEENRLAQRALWRLGISGDHPMITVRVRESGHMALVREAIRMHEYWRMKGLIADLILLHDGENDYLRPVRGELMETVEHSAAKVGASRAGGVWIIDGITLPDEERVLLLASSCLLLDGGTGDIAAHIAELQNLPGLPTAFVPSEAGAHANPQVRGGEVLQAMGWGGFTREGYGLLLSPRQPTPAPWSNIMANKFFGAMVTERGLGYAWAGNARENKLFPWSNDPVLDPSGAQIWVRDEMSGDIAEPLRDGREERWVEHMPGASAFQSVGLGLRMRASIHVDAVNPMLCITLALENPASDERRLSVLFAAQWVLGAHRKERVNTMMTGYDDNASLLWARYPGSEGVAWAACPGRQAEYSCDRREVFGGLRALLSSGLSGRTGAGLDPCAALRVALTLPPGGEATVTFLIGWDDSTASAVRSAMSFKPVESLEGARSAWSERLDALRVETPNPIIDAMVSRWLPYQAWSSRFYGRTGFYQAGGAIGFRDQLQDILLLMHYDAGMAREHLLVCAAHQFEEGDVQHWWHPPRHGVRTRISDDLLWLPYVLCEYMRTTGDRAVLSETVPYLSAPPLLPGQEDSFTSPDVSAKSGTLLEHAVLAVHRACRFGVHGLPLIGGGDWNDAMNRVGLHGQGESVWLGWFLIAVIRAIDPVLRAEGMATEADGFSETAHHLAGAIERHGWDGAWYRRAFDDDGTIIGSQDSDEARIDCIAQSWAVISGAADPQRARMAMQSLERYLWMRDEGILRLLWPPFDQGALMPGYIKGYVPGVRENAGQYTHGALWAIQAYAMLGDAKRAFELFSQLLPTAHADTREKAARYRVEPYVVAADVYSQPPNLGRGGWTWYTGSASWMARIFIETLLGYRREGKRVTMKPCLPEEWPEASVIVREGRSSWRLRVRGTQGKLRVTVDGVEVDEWIELYDDGRPHEAVFERRMPLAVHA